LKKNFKKLLCAVIVVALLVSAVVVSHTVTGAEPAKSSPLSVSVRLTKKPLSLFGIAEVAVTVTNTSGAVIQNVSAKPVFDQLRPYDDASEFKKEVSVLAPGESLKFSYKAVLSEKSPFLSMNSALFLTVINMLRFRTSAPREATVNEQGRTFAKDLTAIKFGTYSATNIVYVWYKDPNPPVEGLIVNQIYGIGSRDDDSQAGSHSFVELYNPTEKPVRLNGWSLQAAGNGADWSVLPLEGILPPNCSFLVVLTMYSNSLTPRLVLDPGAADMIWPDTFFPNKGLKVALIKGVQPLTVENPFDIDGSGTKAPGYADMIGVAGNDAGNTIDGYEFGYRGIQSKQVAIRRINFVDTDNNILDIEGIDYRTADLEKYRPRCLADGPILPESSEDPEPEGEGLIVNQIYGIGSRDDDSQAGSHSFVELYNPTGETVNLSGWSLQAAGNGTNWSVLPLEGTIPPNCSFLVVLTMYSNTATPRLVLNPQAADMLWPNVFFPNKGLKVALMKGLGPLTVPNPFDIDGEGTKVPGYSDMIGVAGNDAGNTIDGCELGYRGIQSKQVAIRRINFIDTDNNILDIEGIDYRTADMVKYGPRCLADGPVLPEPGGDPEGEPLPGTMPRVDINLLDGKVKSDINTKEFYLGAHIGIKNAGQYNVSLRSAGVRLRGNSTAGLEKKPFRIKFDTSVSMFGRPKEKSWTLIANHMDYSLMRNFAAYNMHAYLTPPGTFTSLAIPVEVYINGQYEGVYTLCDQMKVGKGRVDISEEILEPENTDYMLELNYRAPDDTPGEEGSRWFRVEVNDAEFLSRWPWGGAERFIYDLKSPDPDDWFLPEHVAYMKQYMQSVQDALEAGDWETTQALVDVESFIDFFMVTEVFKMGDVAGFSVFMSKPAGGKLTASSVWDFDLSAGSAGHYPYKADKGFWAERVNYMFAGLMMIPEFFDLYTTRYLAVYEDLESYLVNLIDGTYETYGEAFERNFERWDNLLGNTAFSPNPWATYEMLVIPTFEGQVDYLRDWLVLRINWLADVYTARRAGADYDTFEDYTPPFVKVQ